MSKRKVVRWSKKPRSVVEESVFHLKYRISPEDLASFVVCSTATFALNFFIIAAAAYKEVVKDLPAWVALTISASDIYFAQYEVFFKFDYPLFWVIMSFTIAVLLRYFNRFDINDKKVQRSFIIYFIALALSSSFAYFVDINQPFLFLFVLGLCFGASQVCSRFLTSVAIINCLVFTTMTLYITKSVDDNKKSSLVHVQILTNGTLCDYSLIANTKKGALVINANKDVVLIPNEEIELYKSIAK